MAYFVEDLINSVKLRTLAPIAQATYDDDDLVVIGNDELPLVVSDVMSVREDYFLTTKSVTLTSGLDRYTIPSRSIGSGLKVLFVVDSNGNRRPIERVDVDQSYLFQGNGDPARFYFEGDEVVILPTPTNNSYSLLFSYYAKPSNLILTSSCAKITAISSVGGTTTLTVNTDLTGSLSIGSRIDFLSAASPFLLWAERSAITAISSTQIQVATADLENAVDTVEPQVDDYICPTGFANIPMLPPEYFHVLAQRMAVRVLAGLGDLNKWQAAKLELKEMEQKTAGLIKNRAESSPERMNNRKGFGYAFR